jgi:general stress protein YciG
MNTTNEQPKVKRGWAAMSAERRREISRLGGKASHASGRGHRWTSEEAREAGKKGGKAPKPQRRYRDLFSVVPAPETGKQ